MATSSSHRTSAFVPRDERERLLELYVELVAERGFEQVSLSDLALEASADPDQVRGYFGCTEDCALAAFEAFGRQMFTACATAFLSTAGDCPLAARAALGAMLRFMAGVPAAIHFVVTEFGSLGPRAEEARRRCLDLFAEFLGPGFAAARETPPCPQTLSLLIGGGIYELMSRYEREGRLAELPEALPALTYFTVAPFFGVEEARRVSSLPMPTTGS